MNRPDQRETAAPAVGTPLDGDVGRARINAGVLVAQDFGCGRWPATKAGENVDPEMVFDVEWMGTFWECRADGFGRRTWLGEHGGYGNGAIFVFDRNGLTLLDQEPNVGTKLPAAPADGQLE